MIRRRIPIGSARQGQQGFSLLEVLIALLVLGIGLLGLALLQTTNLRFTQSAHQRTQAANLASSLFDMIRANHTEAAAYSAITFASFDDSTTKPEGCGTPTALTSAGNIERWSCEVRETLGADAQANVEVDGDVVTVEVTWGDEYWLDEDEVQVGAGSVIMETRL